MRPSTAVFVLLLAGCAASSVPRIDTSGPNSVSVGESITVTARTVGAADNGYRWEVEDDTIVTVDVEGKVTGLQRGETRLKVTGLQSTLSAAHVIVVISATSEPDAGLGDAMPVQGSLADFEMSWSQSPHADPTAEAFTHWADDGEVPTACARCHTSEGYIDFLGGDGTAPGTVERPGSSGSLVRCEACHNDAASKLTSVTFPSGVTVDNLGASARCMVCHQGRSSTPSVNTALDAVQTASDDEASDQLRFLNIHYYPAAATLLAGQVQGGYQYAGRVYDTRFRHVPEFDTCAECHNPHSTKVRFDKCSTCHPGVSDAATAHDIRMIASRNQDYDGDGNTTEGIYHEIVGLQDLLLTAVIRYGKERAKPLCYDPSSYPYWFKDQDDDGTCSDSERDRANAYDQWTKRLMRAAYNYHLSKKEPGAFAHNAKYVIQLLHDALVDLNVGLAVKLDLGRIVRTDDGHFNGASQAARRWDGDEAVSAACSSCHGGAEGFRFFVEFGTGREVLETANGLECFTCHESFGGTYALLEVSSTTFPGGTTLALPGDDNLCATCHSGRESKATIDASIASGSFRFRNVHYRPAAAVLVGNEAHVGYEYSGKTYAGRMSHQGGTQCTTCHHPQESNHTFRVRDVWQGRCNTCHGDENAAEEVRLVHPEDYDGDGNTDESLREELDGMADKLITALRAASGPGGPLCYGAGAYPYFFKDTDNSGPICSAAEAARSNSFSGWNPDLMKGAHNYQLSRTDPGAWAHNFDYIGQLIFDSVEALSGSSQGLTRP